MSQGKSVTIGDIQAKRSVVAIFICLSCVNRGTGDQVECILFIALGAEHAPICQPTTISSSRYMAVITIGIVAGPNIDNSVGIGRPTDSICTSIHTGEGQWLNNMSLGDRTIANDNEISRLNMIIVVEIKGQVIPGIAPRGRACHSVTGGIVRLRYFSARRVYLQRYCAA